MTLLKSRIGLGSPLNLLPREKNFCISSLHPYEDFQVAFSPVLSTQPCVFLSVALLAKSAFPGDAARPGSAVLLCLVKVVSHLVLRSWDRGDVGMGTGWCPSLGCPCSEAAVLWFGAVPELSVAAVPSPGVSSACWPQQVLTAVQTPALALFPRLLFSSGGSHGCPTLA